MPQPDGLHWARGPLQHSQQVDWLLMSGLMVLENSRKLPEKPRNMVG